MKGISESTKLAGIVSTAATSTYTESPSRLGNAGRNRDLDHSTVPLTAAAKKPASESGVSCVKAQDPNLLKLANAIAARVGPQRFHVWFDNSTRLDLRNDGLEICVPNDFIGEWIGQRFTGTIQEAALEVFGGPLRLKFQVVPELFDKNAVPGAVNPNGGHSNGGNASATKSSRSPATTGSASVLPVAGHPARNAPLSPAIPDPGAAHSASRNTHATEHSRTTSNTSLAVPNRARLRHDLSTYVVGPSNQLAHNAALHVAEFPGTQYNPLFIHGSCGLGKTHLLQGLCQKFIGHHPTRKWLYCTAEEFTNDYLAALRTSKVEAFRRKMRELDLLIIDDVHFLSGKKATQEEFLHTFNAIEALGKQVVMASDSHPKEIAEFGESLVNRFVSGMVVRVDPPNFSMRCDILRKLADKQRLALPEEVLQWVAKRVTQNVRELEGAITRIGAHVMLTGTTATVELAQEALGDLDRASVAPVKPENVLTAVATHFGIESKDLMSGRRHHTVSLARSIAMYLIRRTARLSYPEIGQRLGKRNHSTVISACRRIESAITKAESFTWSGALGDRVEESSELVQRLEEHARAMA